MAKAAKEKWFDKRKEHRIKIQAKVEQKSIEKIAEKESDLAADIHSAAEELLAKIRLATEQLDICLVKEKRKYTRQVVDPNTKKVIYVDVEEERIKKDNSPDCEKRINKGELKQLASALKDLQTIQFAQGQNPNESNTITFIEDLEPDE